MDTLVGIVILIALVVGVALFLFYFVVHPIWGIIDCAVSTNQSSGEKTVWIIVMVLGWGFGSALYRLVSASPLRNCIYGLVDSTGTEWIRQMLDMTSDGAVLRSIKRSPPVPTGALAGRGLQFLANGTKLLIISPASRERGLAKVGENNQPDRRYLLDPANGRVVELQ